LAGVGLLFMDLSQQYCYSWLHYVQNEMENIVTDHLVRMFHCVHNLEKTQCVYDGKL